jgi:putative component of toxin-antitoxin plasmid stabilization module
MPPVRLVFYREDGETVPVREWLTELRKRNRRAFAKCLIRLRRLAELGHELRRPEADYLRDGIYELRVREGRVNYRILYGFHNRLIAVLAHGLTKESDVPSVDIEKAIERMSRVNADPDSHLDQEDLLDG